jgi:cytochrome c-type biogenesis protein
MGIELASVPLAFLAGVIGILSPCVWPLVPIIMSSAANSGHFGPLFLALGLATAFAVAGTFLSLLLLNLGLNPDVFRYVATVLLILIAFLLISKRLGEWASNQLSLLTSRFNTAGGDATGSVAGQFGIGALLGLVWLPCVGPTLGAAIALASIGQDLSVAFVVMFAFGVGTAAALLSAAWFSSSLLRKIRPNMMKQPNNGKRILGVLLLALGLMVFTGLDKTFETATVNMLPDWIFSI